MSYCYTYYSSYQCYWDGGLLRMVAAIARVGAPPTSAVGVVSYCYTYYPSYQCYWGGLLITPITIPSSATWVVASLSSVLFAWRPPPNPSCPYYQCYCGGCLLRIPIAPTRAM